MTGMKFYSGLKSLSLVWAIWQSNHFDLWLPRFPFCMLPLTLLSLQRVAQLYSAISYMPFDRVCPSASTIYRATSLRLSPLKKRMQHSIPHTGIRSPVISEYTQERVGTAREKSVTSPNKSSCSMISWQVVPSGAASTMKSLIVGGQTSWYLAQVKSTVPNRTDDRLLKRLQPCSLPLQARQGESCLEVRQQQMSTILRASSTVFWVSLRLSMPTFHIQAIQSCLPRCWWWVRAILASWAGLANLVEVTQSGWVEAEESRVLLRLLLLRGWLRLLSMEKMIVSYWGACGVSAPLSLQIITFRLLQHQTVRHCIIFQDSR